MFNKILKLCNNIHEEWTTSVTPYGEEVKIYSNSDRLELIKLLRTSPDLRGLVPRAIGDNRDYLVFSGLLATHDDILDELKLKEKDYYKIAIYDPNEVILLGIFDESEEFKHTNYYKKIKPSTVEVSDRFEDDEDFDEEWAGSIKTTWKKDDLIDVFKNPSKSELLKMTQGGREPVRFFIALDGDFYVWKFADAMHDEVARQLKLGYRVKGSYYNTKYIEFFKVKTPEKLYPEVENSKIMNVLDKDFHDNLLRRKLVGVAENKNV